MVVSTIPVSVTQAAPRKSAQSPYLQDDLSISATSVTPSSTGGKPLLLAQGNVVIKINGYTYNCDNAVIWGNMAKSSKVARRKFELYLEGNLTVTDPTGNVETYSDSMLNLNVNGRLKFKPSKPQKVGKVAAYQRALAARKRELARKFYAPPVIENKSETGNTKTKPVKEPKTGSDNKNPVNTGNKKPINNGGNKKPIQTNPPVDNSDNTWTTPQPVGNSKKQPEPKPVAIPKGKQIAPVSIDAKGVTYEAALDENGKPTGKRIGVIKDKFYITQGATKDTEHLILKADKGIVFTEVLPAKKQKDSNAERLPYQAPVFKGPDGGQITGVYLEGDVVIRQGERTVRAKSAYFDFRYSRAIVTEPVFRTIQEQRNIPIYIRGSKLKMLSNREMEFVNAVVTVEDFVKPISSIKARRLRVKDETEFDSEGERISKQKSLLTFENAYVDLYGVPVLPMGSGQAHLERGHTALRRAGIGTYRDFGLGIRSEWHLFRLLGLVQPKWIEAHLNAEYYEKGAILGIDGRYARKEEDRQYAGYFRGDSVYDRKREDDFGDDRRDVMAPRNTRGRLLIRHKEYLADDWMLQAEMSLISDRNFMEKYYPAEFWSGKDQENVIYARKQRDNWAITAMVKGRFNSFLTQTETFPEVAAYMVGQPLLGGAVTYFGEGRAAAQRYQYGDPINQDRNLSPFSSGAMFTFDTRHEFDVPLEIATAMGNMKVVPFVSGRVSYWSQAPSELQKAQQSMLGADFAAIAASLSKKRGSAETRLYGMAGARASMTFWKLYSGINSKLWDLNGIRHIVTPELVFYTGGTSVAANDLFKMNPSVEPYIRQNTGISFAVYNRLQTKRGPAGNQRVVDWMRFNVRGAYFSNPEERDSGHGELYAANPEYSRARNYVAAEWLWNISDSMTMLADASFDTDQGRCDIMNIGLSVRRDPRLTYFAGFRYNQELNTAIATVGADYKINRKFTIRAFERYDFKYDGGVNLGTSVTLIRKLSRYYVGLTLNYDARYQGNDEYSAFLTLWPEGIPEARLKTGRFGYSEKSSDN